jgi:Flp pilus assembly protein TadG
MIRLATRLRRDRKGGAAVEFALVAPVLLSALVGVAQLGILFFANAGLSNAVAEGARYATIFPRPSNTQIRARITDQRFGLNPTYLTTPTITAGTSNGATFLDISMSYNVPLNFVFFTGPSVTLTKTRRAYVY